MDLDTDQVVLGGVLVDLVSQDDVLHVIEQRLTDENPGPPLAIASANLDHIHHFADALPLGATGGTRWLTLLDGMPLVARARRLTGRTWPRLAGADLIEPILELAAGNGWSVGVLGGQPETHEQFRARLAERYPALTIAGTWAPERATVLNAARSAGLATNINERGVRILFVSLGKPRQEYWIEQHSTQTGASVLLAFGAAVDFVAGVVPRSPEWTRRWGLEWAYRLMREPRRLARRYLAQGPPALWRLLRRSHIPAKVRRAAMP